MKKIALFLLLTGLATGPGYWIYAKFYTGSRAALITLAQTEGASATAWRSPEFTLGPDMAPVGLILEAHGRFSPNMDENRPPKDRYAATLIRDGEVSKPLAFVLGVKHVTDSNPVFKEHLLYFKQVRAGRYHLEITPAADPEIHLDRVQLEVRQHLHEPDSRVVSAGMAAMAFGLLGLFL